MSTDGLKACAVPGCDKRIKRLFLMCSKHWYTLPHFLRKRIWNLYVPGQEDDITKVSQEYYEALHQALAILAGPKMENVDG